MSPIERGLLATRTHTMSIELYKDPNHCCVMFTDLVEEDGAAVQANQFLIVDHEEGVIMDPGGNMTYNELCLTMRKYIAPQHLDYIIASHADPDIIASLDRWMTSSKAKLVISTLWARFAPHFCKIGKTEDRIIGVPDEGGRLRFGKTELWLLPAHFMHSEGNFQFYDPVSKILFTGDLGVSMLSGEASSQFITDLSVMPAGMEAFHKRYMVSNKILKLWVCMVRELEISMIVPQHGAPLKGAAIGQLINWLDGLACGIDLMGAPQYQIPKLHL